MILFRTSQSQHRQVLSFVMLFRAPQDQHRVFGDVVSCSAEPTSSLRWCCFVPRKVNIELMVFLRLRATSSQENPWSITTQGRPGPKPDSYYYVTVWSGLACQEVLSIVNGIIAMREEASIWEGLCVRWPSSARPHWDSGQCWHDDGAGTITLVCREDTTIWKTA